ncbi:MAG: Cytochrome c-type protein NrfH [Anaerolineales bacterium]|nr:Cytochrome c-type protein NrfH [Anaerolineales bacterium]
MKWRTVFLISIVALLGLLSTMTVVHALEQRPQLCASCHEERINYNTWLDSGAAEHHPTCVECHTPAGLYGALHAKARGAIHLVKHTTGQYTEPLHGTVPRAWCTKCHTQEGQLQREHDEAPRFASTSCAECHNHQPGADFEGEEEQEEHEREDEDEEDDD